MDSLTKFADLLDTASLSLLFDAYRHRRQHYLLGADDQLIPCDYETYLARVLSSPPILSDLVSDGRVEVVTVFVGTQFDGEKPRVWCTSIFVDGRFHSSELADTRAEATDAHQRAILRVEATWN